MKKVICKHLDCNIETIDYQGYCVYHFSGGVFGSGETFEQYEIIESDFIDFLKVVPISDNYHLKVHSPILRDIIIRSCVEIELFFKEWAKYLCSENPDIELMSKYNKIDKKTGEIKGAKSWNFPDYYILRENYNIARPLYVRQLECDINVFKQWDSQLNLPNWWNAYNSIKHDGIKSRKNANLENALFSLAALFTLHCANHKSKSYLKQYANLVPSKNFGKLKMKINQITTPLDSKRYLFKDVHSSLGGGFEIETSEKISARASGKGRSV